MSEYKRLTRRDEYGNADIIGVNSELLYVELSFNETNILTDALNLLAELEDKIERGEIGDIVELNKSYKELSQERDFQISKQENFAKQQGFTPDATPYYIALQYKRRAEAAEARLKELREKNNG